MRGHQLGAQQVHGARHPFEIHRPDIAEPDPFLT